MGIAMTNEERELITRFIERVAAPQAQAGVGGSGAPPLPPIDREADALIADLFNRYPEARYRITQMAFVQEHALVEAQNRIDRLQWELQQLRQQAQQSAGSGYQQAGGSPWGAGAQQPPPQPQQSRGFFGNLFGGGSRQAPPQYASAPPPPQYPPNYNPGLFQQQGPGFFGSALRTAAGVAGGVVAADALMNLFSGHHGGLGGVGGFGTPASAAEAIGSPWADAGPQQGGDPYDAGGAPKDEGGDKFAGPVQEDQGGWTPAPDQGGNQGGWDQADNSGWDQASDPGGDPGWSDSGSGDDNLV